MSYHRVQDVVTYNVSFSCIYIELLSGMYTANILTISLCYREAHQRFMPHTNWLISKSSKYFAKHIILISSMQPAEVEQTNPLLLHATGLHIAQTILIQTQFNRRKVCLFKTQKGLACKRQGKPSPPSPSPLILPISSCTTCRMHQSCRKMSQVSNTCAHDPKLATTPSFSQGNGIWHCLLFTGKEALKCGQFQGKRAHHS